MSSALAMILAAGMTVPGDVPKEAMEEIEQGLDLRGRWEGFLFMGDKRKPWEVAIVIGSEKKQGVASFDLRLLLLLGRVVDEGKGRFRASDKYAVLEDILGIYQQDGDRLMICYRDASKGWPTSFLSCKDQSLVILHRVKPAK